MTVTRETQVVPAMPNVSVPEARQTLPAHPYLGERGGVSAARMTPSMHRLQPRVLDVRVNLRRRNVRVP